MTDVTRITPPARPGPFATPRAPMIGRYLIRSPAKAATMRAIDAGLSLLPVRRRSASSAPRRILLANWAHLGDLTVTLGAVRLIRERFPGAHIGYLASSWGQTAVAQSGLVDTIHIIDHVRMNRTAEDRTAKVARHRKTLATAAAEIRSQDYDVAIDFYFYFPAAHPLFYRWGIPVRVGFDSTGGGPLLTHPVRWIDRDRPVSEQHGDLLEAVWPGMVPSLDALRPRLDRDRIAPLPDTLKEIGPFVVLHPGAGAPFKDWGKERWQSLIDRLGAYPLLSRHRIVLTGAGAAEIGYAEALGQGRNRIVNMAGRANWAEFLAIIAGADAVVCPDTVTGHIAAQVGTPVVSLFTGTNNAHQWAPNADRGRVLIEGVSCAPCHRVGCEAMACVRDIAPDAVLAALLDVLAMN